MRYRLSHATHYAYGDPVDLAHHALHLRPRAFEQQKVLDWTLVTTPRPQHLSEHIDHFGNAVTIVTIEEPHRALTVEVAATVEVCHLAPPAASQTPRWEDVRAALWDGGLPVAVEEAEFSLSSPLASVGPEVCEYARPSFPAGRRVLDAVLDFTDRINADFAYDPTATEVSTPLPDVLAGRRGVCQDFAHLQAAGLRGMGLAARYVSGYIRTYPPAGREALRGADASHAWVAVWCGPEAGWIHVDPTNNLVARDEHVVLAWGRDYADVSPIRGVILGGGEQSLSVAVHLMPEEG